MNFLMTPKEVGQVFGISRSMTYKLLKEGVIPSVRLGKLYRVSRESLASFFLDSAVHAPSNTRRSA